METAYGRPVTAGLKLDRRVAAMALAVLSAVVSARCSDDGPPTRPTPPPSANAPPVIRSVTSSWNQVDAGRDVEVAVTAEDAETPPEQLTYSWSAEAGTFEGQGRTVRWKPPVDGPVPRDYIVSVTVTESYTASSGQAAQHRVSGSTPPIRVNDGVREMRQLTETFLNDFANQDATPEYCVRNFSDACRGKQEELEDIENVRELVEVVGSEYRIETIALNSGWTGCTAPTGPQSCAVAVAPVHWTSRVKATGETKHDIGDAMLSGIFDGRQWLLCDSRFFPAETVQGQRPLVR
jgi:hypothetical protein